MKDFLSIIDCPAEFLKDLLRISTRLKRLYTFGGNELCLAGKTLAMLFEKPSLRTRISFHVAMTDLGGHPIYVKPEDIGGIGKREPVKDIARVLSRYVDSTILVARAGRTTYEFLEKSIGPQTRLGFTG